LNSTPSPSLSAADESVARLVEVSWAPSTRDSYEADWGRWCAWAYVHDLDDPLAATGVDVARYVATLADRRLAVATIRRRLAAIAAAYRTADLPSPTRDPLVERTIAGAARTLGTTQRQVLPLRLDQLRRIVTSLAIVTNRAHDHPAVRRDRALLLIGWAGALRRSELVGLDVDDLTIDGSPDHPGSGGLVIRLQTTKTSPTKATHVAIPWSTHTATCPVRAAMHLTRQQRTGPLFRSITRHRTPGRRLTGHAVAVIVKQHVADILGDNPDDYAAHSLRAGFVTEMRSRGIPDARIAKHTRHATPAMLHVYDRPTDLLTDNALAGDWW
jgi:integrase